MGIRMSIRTDVVLVTYNPDLKDVTMCINSLLGMVSYIWVVDNCSQNYDVPESIGSISDQIKMVRLSNNMGIAHAQNVGINMALDSGADYIVLSDQDTTYPKSFVEKMLPVFELNQDKIVAVAPLFHDVVSGNRNEGFIEVSKFGFSRFFPESGTHEILQSIASGLIIKASKISEVGLMDEALFIDWVDLEWCWRVRSKGYSIIGCSEVVIQHNLGDKSTSLGTKTVNLRSPLRHYYITRNAFYLSIHCEYINRWQKITLFSKGLRYVLGYPLLSEPRWLNFKMTCLGMFHGINAKLGRYE